MNLMEAFKALDALNEDTFSISDDGINKLAEFQDNDDLKDEVEIIDLEAETEEDLEDSYVGKVILDCTVCHSKIYKDKAEVTLDEEGTFANVGDECPYCYSSDGYKVVGEVAEFGGKDSEDDTNDITTEDLLVRGPDGKLTTSSDEDRWGTSKEWDYNYSKKESLEEGVFDKFKKNKNDSDKQQTEPVEDNKEGSKEKEPEEKKDALATYSYNEWIEALEYAHKYWAEDGPEAGKMKLGNKVFGNLYKDIVACMDAWMEHEGKGNFPHKSYAKHLSEAAFSGGYASGGSLDTSKRAGGASKKWDNALEGKKTKTVKAKDLKPGMVTSTGEIVKVTDAGYRFGKPVVEISYGSVGAQGSLAADQVSADKDYQVLDESKSIKESHVPSPYDKYFTVSNYTPEENEYQVGDLIAGLKILAYLEPKSEYEDVIDTYPFLVDSNETPVVEIVRDRAYAVDIEDLPELNESKSIKESVNNVNVETDDSIVNVSSDDTGKVTVTTEPAPETEASEGEEVIVPVTDETQAEIEAPGEGTEDVDVEIEDFDEESFDELGEGYLKEAYENVTSFKTTDVSSDDTKIFVEGIVSFESGAKKKTSFIFEAKDTTKSGHVRFTGTNKELKESLNCFSLCGRIEGKKLISESFKYDYKLQDGSAVKGMRKVGSR